MKFKLKLRDIPLILYLIAILFGAAFLAIPAQKEVKINNNLFPLVKYKQLPNGSYFVVYKNGTQIETATLNNLTIVEKPKIKFGIEITGGKGLF